MADPSLAEAEQWLRRPFMSLNGKTTADAIAAVLAEYNRRGEEITQLYDGLARADRKRDELCAELSASRPVVEAARRLAERYERTFDHVGGRSAELVAELSAAVRALDQPEEGSTGWAGVPCPLDGEPLSFAIYNAGKPTLFVHADKLTWHTDLSAAVRELDRREGEKR